MWPVCAGAVPAASNEGHLRQLSFARLSPSLSVGTQSAVGAAASGNAQCLWEDRTASSCPAQLEPQALAVLPSCLLDLLSGPQTPHRTFLCPTAHPRSSAALPSSASAAQEMLLPQVMLQVWAWDHCSDTHPAVPEVSQRTWPLTVDTLLGGAGYQCQFHSTQVISSPPYWSHPTASPLPPGDIPSPSLAVSSCLPQHFQPSQEPYFSSIRQFSSFQKSLEFLPETQVAAQQQGPRGSVSLWHKPCYLPHMCSLPALHTCYLPATCSPNKLTWCLCLITDNMMSGSRLMYEHYGSDSSVHLWPPAFLQLHLIYKVQEHRAKVFFPANDAVSNTTRKALYRTGFKIL